MGRLVLVVALCAASAACQSQAQRTAELQAICADPITRTPGNFYAPECAAIEPQTNAELAEEYLEDAPRADR